MDGDKITRLKSIADLRDSGILTEAEFQEQKSRIMTEPVSANFNQSNFSGEGEPPIDDTFKILSYILSFLIPIAGIIIGIIYYGKPEPWHKEFGKKCLQLAMIAIIVGFVMSMLVFGLIFSGI